MVSVDVSVVLQGIRLCFISARRLNSSARTLLENHGDTGIVFGLWSLAVEEFGRSFLLQDQIRGRCPGEIVSVQPEFSHHCKLSRGINEFVEIRDVALGRALRVAVASSGPMSVSDPLVPSTTITLIPFVTGLYEDTNPEARIAPTVDLRFSLLYVRWDAGAGRWTDARLPHTPSHGSTQWQMSIGDLQHIIKLLEERLCAT